LYAKFDGADSLLNKLDGASLSTPPPPPPAPAVVANVVEKVSYDTATTVEPAAKVVEKAVEAAPAIVAPAATSSVSMPAVDMPAIDLPSIDMPSVGGLDLPLPVLGGIAVAVLVAVALSASGGGGGDEAAPVSSSSSSGSSDVSIPYDAAAMLAWEEAGKPGDFASFKPTYIADTVAMVKSKQKK
jgi:hypothetical protein